MFCLSDSLICHLRPPSFSRSLPLYFFSPHFLPLSPLVFSSSASLGLIGFRSHTSQSSRHFIYSIHAFNEWSNHGAIKCKQPLRIVWQGATSGLPVVRSARRSPFQNFGCWRSFEIGASLRNGVFVLFFVTCISDFAKPSHFQRIESVWVFFFFCLFTQSSSFVVLCLSFKLWFDWSADRIWVGFTSTRPWLIAKSDVGWHKL